VDVFDALVSKRPYKEPYAFPKALDIVEKGRGRHFDPDVVDVFFRAKDEIIAIQEKHKDEGVSLLWQLIRKQQ